MLLGVHMWTVLTFLLAFRTKPSAMVFFMTSFVAAAQSRHPRMALYFLSLFVIKLLSTVVQVAPVLYKLL
jgi:hypothetical protein